MGSAMYDAFYNFDALREAVRGKIDALMISTPDEKVRNFHSLSRESNFSDTVVFYVALALGINVAYFGSILPTIANRTIDLLSFPNSMDIDSFLKHDDLDTYLSAYLLNIGLLVKKNHEDSKIFFDFSMVSQERLDWIIKIGSKLYKEFEKMGTSDLKIVNSKLTWNDVQFINYDKDASEEEKWKKYVFLMYKLRDWIAHYHFKRADSLIKHLDSHLLEFSIDCLVDEPEFIGQNKKVDFSINAQDDLFIANVSTDFLRDYSSFMRYFMNNQYDEAYELLPKNLEDCKYLWQIYALKHRVKDKKGYMKTYYDIKRLFLIDLQMSSSLVLLGMDPNIISFNNYYVASSYSYADYVYIHDSKDNFEDLDFAGVHCLDNLQVTILSNNLKGQIVLLFKELGNNINSFSNGVGYNGGKNPRFNILESFGSHGVMSFNRILEKIGRIKKQIFGTDMRNSNSHKNVSIEVIDGMTLIRLKDSTDLMSGRFEKEYLLPVDDYFGAIDSYARIQVDDYTRSYSKDNYLDDLRMLASYVPDRTREFMNIIGCYESFFDNSIINGHSFYDELIEEIVESFRIKGTYNGYILTVEENDALANYILNSKNLISIKDVAKALDNQILGYEVIIPDNLFKMIKYDIEKKKKGH